MYPLTIFARPLIVEKFLSWKLSLENRISNFSSMSVINEINFKESLRREVREETNLTIKLISEDRLLKTKDVEQLITPRAIIQEKIPSYKDEPVHFHVDNIYFAFCKNPQKIKMDEEYAWFSRHQLKFGLEKEVEVFAKKAIDKASQYMVF